MNRSSQTKAGSQQSRNEWKTEWQTAVSNVFYGFMLLKRCYSKALDPLVKESGLTQIELEILLFLSNNPHLNTATDISSNKLMTKSHVSTALRHLESIGFIRRYYDQNNRKTIYISLEPASFSVVHKGILLQKEYAASLMRGISQEELQMLHATMDKIFANARTMLDENQRSTDIEPHTPRQI